MTEAARPGESSAPSAYETLENLVQELGGWQRGEYSLHEKSIRLSDGKSITFYQNRRISSDPLEQDLYIEVNAYGFGFMVDREGLLRFNISGIEIGGAPFTTHKRLILDPDDFYDNGVKDKVKGSAEVLVNWVKKVIKENHYSSPPIKLL